VSWPEAGPAGVAQLVKHLTTNLEFKSSNTDVAWHKRLDLMRKRAEVLSNGSEVPGYRGQKCRIKEARSASYCGQKCQLQRLEVPTRG
jgi:hypothetical protein